MDMLIRNSSSAVPVIFSSSILPSPTLLVHAVIRLSLMIPMTAAASFRQQAVSSICKSGARHILTSRISSTTPMLFLITTADPITTEARLSAAPPIPGIADTIFCSVEVFTVSITGVITYWNTLMPVTTPIIAFSAALIPFSSSSISRDSFSSIHMPFTTASST